VTGATAPGAGPGPGATATAGTKRTAGIFPAGATYQYAISYVDSAGEESALSSTFSVVIPGTTIPAESISLASLAAGAPAGTRSIKIYRTKANGTQLYYLASVAGTKATYKDTTPDASLGSFVAPYPDLAPVPFPTSINGTALATPFNPLFFDTDTNVPGQGLAKQTAYSYEFDYVDATGQPSTAEKLFFDTSTNNGFIIDLSAYAPAAGTYWLIYRSGATDNTPRLVGVLANGKKTSFTDTTPDSQRGPALYTIGTAPHGDSRAMAFIGNTLIEADDGGINQLTNPNGVVTGARRLLAGTGRQPRGRRILLDRIRPTRPGRHRGQPGHRLDRRDRTPIDFVDLGQPRRRREPGGRRRHSQYIDSGGLPLCRGQ